MLFAQDQETLHIKSAVAAEDPAFPDYVAALTGSGITRGDEYQMLVNGVQIFPAMLACDPSCAAAHQLRDLHLRHGEVGEEFTTALADAAGRGVEVRLIVDAVGASGMESEHVERLQRAGVQIGTFNPLKWHSIEEINYRTHRKILVVDGDVAFTGGAGVADHWLGNARGAGALARHAPARDRARRDDARSGVLRELGGDRAHQRPAPRSAAAAARNAGALASWRGARRAAAATA